MSTSLYNRTEIVGRGKFGVVYKGYNKQTNKLVAIKVLNLDTQEDEVTDVQQEIQFLTELKNVPNVTHYYGSFLNDTKLWIIMDYCAGGSLRTLLKAGAFEDRYIGVIVRELLYALSAVHKLGVIHRDIKAANVLITKEGYVQLCDFGVAAKITANALKRTTMAGTPYWMAPEVIREGDVYNSKADIWSLGITIYEIATGNPPYCDKDAMWAMQLISKLTPPRLEGREYSTALKECIALCLDENPEERPSADDLLVTCRLVKTYKNHSRSILKEVVSRYLLWRDHNSSRDSIFVNLDDEIQQNDDSEQNGRPQNNENEAAAESKDVNNSNQIQVKWDFDSLSSKEYIVENDIDLDRVDESYQDADDSAQDTYQTLPTLQAGTIQEGYNNSTAGKYISNGYNSSTFHATTKSSANEIPKSLQMLFEEDAELPVQNSIPSNLGYEMPTARTSFQNERMDSPTIEIPDMDNLANFNTTTNTSHPALNKPPSLNHSQSASGNLESRYTSLNSSSALNNKPRKKTISNSLGNNTMNSQMGVSQLQLSQLQAQATPHTPPYSSMHNSMKTPSPKPPSTSVIINSTNTSSPSKSMKALQSNSNPLLQPINFKLTGDSNSSTTNSPAFLQASQGSTASFANSVPSAVAPPVSSMASNGVLAKPSAKSRSGHGFHIQMPTPSTAFNNLSALTNESFTPANNQDNENVNQFGINPSQLVNQPLTMTPVTEKEHLFANDNDNDHESNHLSTSQARDRSESNVSLRIKKSSISNPSGNPMASAGSSTNLVKEGNPASANILLSRGNGSISSASSNTLNTTRFPAIPQINGEFFIDSTPKQKLVNELDAMIKLFNQGLDALEENL